MFKDYLKRIGLEEYIPAIEDDNLKIVEEALEFKDKNFSPAELERLYKYDIPKLSPDGTCSLIHEKEENPYDLSKIIGKEEATSQRLWQLQVIVKKLQKATDSDWLGIYKKMKKKNGEWILLKEAYYGAISRPEFPLTEEFAQNSNNSTVGLSGKAIIVKDVASYSGPYYECDSKVNSEICCPILNKKGEVIGIIDAEAFASNFFTPQRVVAIARVCFDLGQMIYSR